MIDIIFGTLTYTVILLGCIDGDTCKIKFKDTPEIIAEQKIRFYGFDTPEIRTKCKKEKELGYLAKNITEQYLRDVGVVYFYEERSSKYGDLLVEAPELKKILITKGLAKEYYGKKKEPWC